MRGRLRGQVSDAHGSGSVGGGFAHELHREKLALASSVQTVDRRGWRIGRLGIPYRVSGRGAAERRGWVITMHAAGTASVIVRGSRRPASRRSRCGWGRDDRQTGGRVPSEGAMTEYDPGSSEGIPSSGVERLEQNREGLYTSDLSVSEFLLVTQAEIRPGRPGRRQLDLPHWVPGCRARHQPRHGWGSHVIEFFALGTAIVSTSPGTRTQIEPPVPVLDLNDRWTAPAT